MPVRRVRVELREIYSNASLQEREIAFRKMNTAFKKACMEGGIQHSYKRHEFYESPGQKKRRKRREAESARLKAKLKENFPEKKKSEKQ